MREFEMDNRAFTDALGKMRDASQQRKFTQSAELIINLRGLDMKKPDNRVDVDVALPHDTGRKGEAKALVFARDKTFASQLKGKHEFMMEEQIPKLKKKDVSEILTKYNILLAEGPVMLTVGKYLGQELAAKNRMPKPIEPELGAVEALLAAAGTGIKVTNSKGKFMPVVQCAVGNEKNSDKELAENALAVYNAVMSSLEKKEHNVKSVYVKLTMGPAIKVEAAETRGAKRK